MTLITLKVSTITHLQRDVGLLGSQLPLDGAIYVPHKALANLDVHNDVAAPHVNAKAAQGGVGQLCVCSEKRNVSE